jgi:DNA-binding NarL/FixJ family response regulator
MNVLVVEDGFEYSETLQEFLGEGFTWTRAGSGPAALEALRERPYDALFLDMRFDRAPLAELLGDLDATADRFNGDDVQARRYLEDHQGLYILAALRDAGHAIPVLVSYDFDAEQARWRRIADRQGPVAYLPDNASPRDIGSRLAALIA